MMAPTALVLPSYSGYDVREMILSKIICPSSTNLMVVEKDMQILPHLVQNLARLEFERGVNLQVIRNNLFETRLSDFAWVPNVAYIDTCNTFSPSVSKWLRRVGKNLFSQTEFLGFTFQKERDDLGFATISTDCKDHIPIPMSEVESRNIHANMIAFQCSFDIGLGTPPTWGRVYKEPINPRKKHSASMVTFALKDQGIGGEDCPFDMGYVPNKVAA